MKFVAQVEGLVNALTPAIDVSTKGILKDENGAFGGGGYINLKVADNTLHASAFNGFCGITSDISNIHVSSGSFKFEEDGQVEVSAADLAQSLASFEGEDMIIIELQTGNGKNLVIKKEDDEDQYQMMPVVDIVVNSPKEATKFVKKVTIPISTFLQGANDVASGVGFERSADKQKFLYWIVRLVDGKKVRFASCDFVRLITHEIHGDDLCTSQPSKCNFLISVDHSAVLLKVLSNSDADDMVIRQSDPKEANYQVIVEAGNHTLTMINMQPNIQWPDESKIMPDEVENNLIFTVAEWKAIDKALAATLDGAGDIGLFSKAILSYDTKDDFIKIDVDSGKKTSRKVKIVDKIINLNQPISVKVNVPHLREIAKHGVKDGFVQIGFNNPTDNGDGTFKYHPLIVRHFANSSVSDAAEIKNSLGNGSEVYLTSAIFVTG